MPQVHLVLTGVVHLIFVSFSVRHQKQMEKKKRREQKSTNEDENIDTEEQTKCTLLLSCCDFNIIKSELRTFASMYTTAFGLFYMLFPIIVLMFAYPTQIIVIYTFVTAYLFATTVFKFSASIIKLYNLFTHKSGNDVNNNRNSQRNNQKHSTSETTANIPTKDDIHLLAVHFPVVGSSLPALPCNFCFVYSFDRKGFCDKYWSSLPYLFNSICPSVGMCMDCNLRELHSMILRAWMKNYRTRRKH